MTLEDFSCHYLFRLQSLIIFSSSPAQPLSRPLSHILFFFSFDLPIFPIFFRSEFHISFPTSPFTILLSSWNSLSIFQSHVSCTLRLPFLPPHSISYFVISLPRYLLHCDLLLPLSPSFSSVISLDLTFSNLLLLRIARPSSDLHSFPVISMSLSLLFSVADDEISFFWFCDSSSPSLPSQPLLALPPLPSFFHFLS